MPKYVKDPVTGKWVTPDKVSGAADGGGGAAATAAEPTAKTRTKSDFRKSVLTEGGAAQIRGVLQKKGTTGFKRYQKRYFEVTGHYLKYWDDEKSVSADPKAAIDLDSLDSAERDGSEIALKLGAADHKEHAKKESL